MNITDVMRLVNWEFDIIRDDDETHLVADTLCAKFNPHSCEVLQLSVSGEQIHDLDTIETFNYVAKLSGNETTEESLPVDVDSSNLALIDAAAAIKNLTRNQFIIASILETIKKPL